jgi:DNA polymerase III subunit beta
MKFTCTKENLSTNLSMVGGLANKQTNLPILSNVLIKASDSGVEFVSTNLESAIKTNLRAKVEKSGSFTVPAKTLLDYINLLTDEQIEIEQEENEIVVSCGSSHTKIKGTPADEYPVIPEVTEDHAYMINAGEFKDSLGKVVIAAAKNEIRPELSGVNFSFFSERHKGLVIAATDSYRLSEKKISISQGEDEITCIVPGKTVFEMIRLISTIKQDGAETGVRLWVSENQIAIRYGNFEMTSRLIDGKYPDYVQIIPEKFKTKAEFPKDVVIKKIKAASLFTTVGVNAVLFELNADNKSVGISSTSTQTGEHASQIDSDVQGEENSILLNHKYVLDGLGHMADEIEFHVNSADAPCLFKTKGDEDFLYIVMPIRQ